MFEAENIRDWRGHDVVDADGHKIGELEAIYVDTGTDLPSFGTVKVGMMGRHRLVFVPLDRATVGPGWLKVVFGKKQVKDAPAIETDGELVAEQAGRQVPGGGHGDHRGSRGSRFVRRGQDGRVDLGETKTHGRGVPLLPKMRRWSLHAAHITRRAALLITLVMNGRSAPLVPRPAEINGDVKDPSFRVYLRFHCADVRFDRLS